MSNGIGKTSVRNAQKNALQRIEALEESFNGLQQGISAALNTVDQRVGQLMEVVEALAKEVGEDVVNARVQESRAERAKAQAEAQKTALAKALEDGTYESAEVIGDDSLVTGEEVDKEGNPLNAGYVQLTFSAIKQEFQEKLKGQGVGFVLETLNGGSFKVTGVYNPVAQKEVATVEEKQE